MRIRPPSGSAVVSTALCASALSLGWLGPRRWALPTSPAALLGWWRTDPQAHLAQLAALLAWALICWWALGLLLVTAGSLPSTAHRRLAVAARRVGLAITPRTLVRAARLGVGTTLTVSSGLGLVSTGELPAFAAPATSSSADHVGFDLGIDLDRPASEPRSSHTPGPSVALTPLPRAASPAPVIAPPVSSPSSHRVPRTPSRHSGGVAGGAGRQEHIVVVGESLWAIAARELGPQASPAHVSARWHQWYSVNHDVIGGDPALLYPGTRLVVPPDR